MSSSAAPSTTRSPPSAAPRSTSRPAKRSSASTPADSTRYLPELAHHFTLAAPAAGPERAVDYNLRAAEGAIAAAAYNEAAASLRSALDVGDRRPSRTCTHPGRARLPPERDRADRRGGCGPGSEPRGRDGPRRTRDRGARAHGTRDGLCLCRSVLRREGAGARRTGGDRDPGAAGRLGGRRAGPAAPRAVSVARGTRPRAWPSWSARSRLPMPPTTSSRSGASSRRWAGSSPTGR